MTPLAQQIVRIDGARGSELAPALTPLLRSDCRCFEVSAVFPLMKDLAVRISDVGDDMLFLPAPVTWIEWRTGNAEVPRVGQMFQKLEAGDRYVTEDGDVVASRPGLLTRLALASPTAGGSNQGVVYGKLMFVWRGEDGMLLAELHEGLEHSPYKDKFVGLCVVGTAALALINTPHIVGRRTHLPHAGLQRELARQRKMVGKFPLQAWTEITLDLTPPEEARGEYEAHLSGGRALHFCRAHLRVRLGQVEYVRHHWRGDPSLGIKRSRYTVVPPKLGSSHAGA